MRNFKIKNIDCHAALAMTENTQSGRSMIEMLGVLAIIGVLSVGGIAGYSKAMTKYRINKTIEQITLIAGNVRTFFAPQKNYVGVDCHSNNDGTCGASGCWGSDGTHMGTRPYTINGCPIVKKAKIFPDEMITVTDGKITSITNPFGGGVALSAISKSQSGDDRAFRISYHMGHTGESLEACIELLTHDWSEANVSFVSFGGPAGGSYYLKLPVAVDKAVDVCSTSIKKHQENSYYGIGYPSVIFSFDVNINSEAWINTSWAN